MDVDVVPTNFLASNMQSPNAKDHVPSTDADADMGPSSSSSSRQIIPHGNRKEKGDTRALKMSAVLTQTWRDDLKSGHLLVSLFELYGESILPFIPAPEMSLFL